MTTAQAIERDRNGYAIVRHARRTFYVTPFNELFAVRNTEGAIVRLSDGRQVLVRSESDAIAFIQSGGATR